MCRVLVCRAVVDVGLAGSAGLQCQDALYGLPQYRLHRIQPLRSVSLAFFCHYAFAQLGRHELDIIWIQIEFGGDLTVRQIQPHEI